MHTSAMRRFKVPNSGLRISERGSNGVTYITSKFAH